MGQFKKGHKINLGRKLGPLPKWQRVLLSKLAKQRIKEKATHWKGGKRYINGYVLIYNPAHPSCIDKRYVLEHRLVMENHLGRYLEKKEVVHHINGIRDDNRIENLQLMFKNKHDALETQKRWLSGNLKYNPLWKRDTYGRFIKQSKA